MRFPNLFDDGAILQYPDSTVIAEIHLHSARFIVAALHGCVAANERILDANTNIAHDAVFQNDAAFDFGVLHHHTVIDAGKRADVDVFDQGVFADDSSAAHDAVDDARTGFDSDTPVNLRIFDHAVRGDGRFEFLKHQTVGFEHVQCLAGIHPPTPVDMWIDPIAMIDHPLNGIGDFVFAACRGFDSVDCLKDVMVEHIDADQRQITGRILRFFD